MEVVKKFFALQVASFSIQLPSYHIKKIKKYNHNLYDALNKQIASRDYLKYKVEVFFALAI